MKRLLAILSLTSLVVSLPAAQAAEILSAEFENGVLSIKLKGSTTASKAYGLVGNCFDMLSPPRWFFTVVAVPPSPFTGSEEVDVVFNFNEPLYRIKRMESLGAPGWLYVSEEVANLSGRTTSAATLQRIMVETKSFDFTILGDKKCEHQFTVTIP